MKSAKSNRLLFLPPTVQAGWENQSYRTDFENLKTLGKGSFGLVWQARHKKTGKIYAIKQIKKKAINSTKMLEHVKTQVRIMYLLNHPNIIKLYNHFEDDFSIYFVLQFAQKGELYRHMMNECQDRRLTQQQASKYTKQVVEALIQIHRQNIIHRDIKPQNILLDKQGNVKLADFGWSNFVEQIHTKRETYCGTLDYLAPQMIQKSHKHDYRVDIWSVGVLVYELVNGFSPFSYQLMKNGDVSEMKVKENIARVNYKFTQLMSEDCRDLVGRILVKEPQLRLGLVDILAHKWITRHNPIKQPNVNYQPLQQAWYQTIKSEFHNITNTQSTSAFTEDEIYHSTRIEGILNKKILEHHNQKSKQFQSLQLRLKQLQLENKIKDEEIKDLRCQNEALIVKLTRQQHVECKQRTDRLMQTIREQSEQIKTMHLKILENERLLREYARK